jgi:hypothetical protein
VRQVVHASEVPVKFRELLQREGITSEESLRSYIAAHYGEESKSGFRILKRSDLKLDSEHRLYNDEIKFDHVIFDVEHLVVRDACSVDFSTCIFTGDLTIGQHTPTIAVHIFRCIFGGKVTIGGLAAATDVHVDTVNSPELTITSCDFNELHMTACNIGHLILDGARGRSFETYANHFPVFEVSQCEFTKVRFDYAQVTLLNQSDFAWAWGGKRTSRNALKAFNRFHFPGFPTFDLQAEQSGRAQRASTMQFLLEHSNVRLDRDAFARAKHFHTLASEKRDWIRGIYIAVGSLIMPWRVLVTMLVSISFFALLFALPCFSINVSETGKTGVRSLGFLESLYFSGVAFTTIGFGDLTPIGLARGLAVAEGLLGVLLGGAFLVALYGSGIIHARQGRARLLPSRAVRYATARQEPRPPERAV